MARVVVRFDRRGELAVLPLEDDDAPRLLAGIPEEARNDCWWLVLRDGTAIPGDAGGGVAFLNEVRMTRPVGRIVRAARAASLVDGLDKLVTF